MQPSPEPPFIGRGPILDEVSSLMRDAETFLGHCLLLSGEAGIGKTTIVERMEEEARGRGWTVAKGECIFGEGSDPYLPLVQALHEHLPAAGGPFLPTVATAPSPSPSITGARADLNVERTRIFESFSEALDELAEEAPVLLIIEDLHWAENATCQLLLYLARSMSDQRVLFIGTYRPEDVTVPGGGGGGAQTHPLLDLRSRLSHLGLLVDRDLGRFTEEETSELLKRLVGMKVPPKMASKIHQDTGGNPFFITEFVSAFHESVKAGAEGRSDGPSAPGRLSDFIDSRLERLGDDETKAVEFGAVIGRDFTYPVLLAVSSIPEDALVDILERLLRHRLLEEAEEGGEVHYRFVHSLIREEVYSRMSRSKRRLLHRRVGAALEKGAGGGGGAANPFQLAYHFSRSTDLERALTYNIMAASHAMGTFAVEEAGEYLKEALSIISRLDETRETISKEIEVLNRLGWITRYLGDVEKALEYHNEALKLIDGESSEMATTYRDMAEAYLMVGRWEEAKGRLRDSIRISERLGDGRGAAGGYNGLAYIAWKTGRIEEVQEWANRAIEEATKVDDRSLVGRAYLELGCAEAELENDLEKALSLYDEAQRWLDPQKDMEQLARIHNNTGDVLTKMGRIDAALNQFEKCLEMAEKTGEMSLKGYAVGNIALCLFKLGKYDEAEPYLERALRLFEKVGITHMAAMIFYNKGQIARVRGQLDEAEVNQRTALDMVGDSFPIGRGGIYHELGLVFRDMGEVGRARGGLIRAMEIWKGAGVQKLYDEAKGNLDELDRRER